MNTKKDMIRSAQLVKSLYADAHSESMGSVQRKLLEVANVVEDTFVRFYIADNPRFDEKRFRDACKPRQEDTMDKRLFDKAVSMIRFMSRNIDADDIRPLSDEEEENGVMIVYTERAKGLAVWQARESFVGLFAAEDGFDDNEFREACKNK